MKSNEFPIIKTDRLLLRQIEETDLENVFRGLSHPDIVKYYGVSYKTLEETKEQMAFFADLEKNGTGIWWAVCSDDNQTFYGAGGLNNWSKEHRKAEIGFWLLTDFWGQGIMNEAMPLICKYGFEKMDLHRIEGFVETDNTNCKKAMEKLDFYHEGTLRDCEVKDGKFISLDVYAMLSNDREQLTQMNSGSRDGIGDAGYHTFFASTPHSEKKRVAVAFALLDLTEKYYIGAVN